jgi:hypothetical protein
MMLIIIWTRYFLLEQGYGDWKPAFVGQQEFDTIGEKWKRMKR